MYYKGEITDTAISLIIEQIEGSLDQKQAPTRVRKKIIYMIIECLQNIYNYFKDKPYEKTVNDESCLDIKVDAYSYTINVSNYVTDESSKSIIKKIEYINSLSPEELHEMYLQVLSSQQVSPSGGAGLGLIDIARKSGKNLSYILTPNANGDIYFTLQISILNN